MDPASQADPHAVTPGGKPRTRSIGIPLRGLPVGELLADDNPMAEYFAAPPGAG